MNPFNTQNRASQAQCFADASRLCVDSVRSEFPCSFDESKQTINPSQNSEKSPMTPMAFIDSFIKQSEQYFAFANWQLESEYRNNDPIAINTNESIIPA